MANDQPGNQHAAGQTTVSCPKRRITIVLQDPGGNPVKDEAYKLSKNGEEDRTGTLDDQGSAIVEDLDPGSWHLTFPDRGFDEWHKVTQPEEPENWIEIALVDAEGRPVPKEPYEVILPDQETKVTGNLDAGGRARIETKGPGLGRVNFPDREPASWSPVSSQSP